MKDYVFCIHACAKFSVHVDAAHFHGAERHGLSGQDIANLSSTDTEGNGAECSVGGGVGVTTSDGGSWLGDALLRADHVHNALFPSGKTEVGNAELFRVLVELLNHGFCQRIGKRRNLAVGRDNVIHCREGAMRVSHFKAKVAEHSEGLWAGDLVNEVGVDQ